MTGHEKRLQIFAQTMQVCAADEAVNRALQASIANQRLLWQEDEEPCWAARFEQAAQRTASIKRSFEAARPYALDGKKVCVLNFASSVSPGGGVTRGSQAQEESLCRVSTLYPALSHENVRAFYQRHWDMIHARTMTRENRDDCIYTPGVTVLREDAGEEALLPPEERYTVDVITCAAPDLRPVQDASRYAPTEEALFALLSRRWKRILALAAANEADVLILGAFGCGVFANPPQLAAAAFEQAVQGMERCFEAIEFAVYSRSTDAPNYQAFAKITTPQS